jgi:nitrogen fixation/metabolism regulation signal transduction histidine kinase
MNLQLQTAWTKRAIRLGAGMALLTALALIYFLIRAVDHESLSEQNIGYLLVLNGLVAFLLLCTIAAISWRLRQRLKEGRFGSKLLIKLAAIFALVGVLPGMLIYSVSYQFVSRSIESWFDVRVEAALEAGLNLGRASLDAAAVELSARARAQTQLLEFGVDGALGLGLDRLRVQIGADDAQVWSQSGLLVGSSGESRFQLAPEKPTSAQMRSLKTQRSIHLFEGLEEAAKLGRSGKPAKLKVFVALGSSGLGLQEGVRYLVVSQQLPDSLVSNAVAVQSAYSEYQARALSRLGLKKMYIGTLTLSLFLAVLGAFILAVILGNQLVRPLLVLALGVEKVSQGDLSPNLELTDDNELAGLTRSFASMTAQLAQARAAEQKTERVKAWNEVAQRVAHEIKNPLTPIQLSAERLAMKLAGKLEGADLALLHKSVKTIVDQVDAMKRLVNEFRDYARLPTAELMPLSLQTVIIDTLQLYEHEVQSGVVSFAPAALPAGADFMIEGDVQQLRQVVHNLLQNALDAAKAHCRAEHGMSPKVTVSLALDVAAGLVTCLMTDNGAGFAEHILARAFEPYNTTKPKGTGLGLAVVRKTIQEHRGDITLSNWGGTPALGAVVRLSFPFINKGVGI